MSRFLCNEHPEIKISDQKISSSQNFFSMFTMLRYIYIFELPLITVKQFPIFYVSHKAEPNTNQHCSYLTSPW
jgi:hypothetical protein